MDALCLVKCSINFEHGHQLRPRKKGFQNIIVKRSQVVVCSISVRNDRSIELPSIEDKKRDLLIAINGVRGRGRVASEKQKKEIEEAVAALESEGGLPSPATSDLIEGRWQLIYTTRPGTASPIQRTFVGVDSFSVYQEIILRNTDDPRVINTVKFSDKFGELNVEASASVPQTEDRKRISFRFDRAAFKFPFWPYTLPYPVPFRLLGDKAKGWLDTTYLAPDGTLRLARGNKGTTFVLQRNPSPKERLLLAVKTGKNIPQAIADLAALTPPSAVLASSVDLNGKWRLVWSSQASDANKLQRLTAGIGSNWQIIDQENNRLENLVEFFSGFRLRAGADTKVVSNTRTEVFINGATIEIGGLKIPVGVKGEGWIELLYLDGKLRVSKGNKGSVFIHVRDA